MCGLPILSFVTGGDGGRIRAPWRCHMRYSGESSGAALLAWRSVKLFAARTSARLRQHCVARTSRGAIAAPNWPGCDTRGRSCAVQLRVVCGAMFESRERGSPRLPGRVVVGSCLGPHASRYVGVVKHWVSRSRAARLSHCGPTTFCLSTRRAGGLSPTDLRCC